MKEDDGDRSAAGSIDFGAVAPLNTLRISNTDSSPGNLFAAGARSFYIRHKTGYLAFDSGDHRCHPPNGSTCLSMIATDGDLAPEGLTAYRLPKRQPQPEVPATSAIAK